MRILVLTPFYAPDLGPSAALYEMLCQELAGWGHEVSVICAVPHYPTGRVRAEFRGRWVQRERCGGVNVTRVWVPSVDRSRLGLRLMSFLCYQLLAAVAGIRRDYDVVIASNPAFEIALPLFLLAFFRGKPVIYSVHELYPEVGVALGIFRHQALVRLLDWLERFCCRRAARVRVLSTSYKRALEAKGVPETKLALIGDWVDTDWLRPQPRHNAFSREWCLDRRFVVLYAGNIGPTQGLESVLDAAQLLAGEQDIRFVFVGDGGARTALEASAQSRGLANVVFLPFQPRERLPEVLATADVSLVSLRAGLAADSVPSKLFSILASGRPAVAAVDAGSEIARLVAEGRCGRVVAPGDARAMSQTVLELQGNEERRLRMGDNGRELAVRLHSKRNAAERFEELLLSACPAAALARGVMPEQGTLPHG